MGVRWVGHRIKPHSGECGAVCLWLWLPTDLFAFSVRGGVVGDFVAVKIQNILHLVVVSSSLANNHSHVKQEDMPGGDENTG